MGVGRRKGKTQDGPRLWGCCVGPVTWCPQCLIQAYERVPRTRRLCADVSLATLSPRRPHFMTPLPVQSGPTAHPRIHLALLPNARCYPCPPPCQSFHNTYPSFLLLPHPNLSCRHLYSKLASLPLGNPTQPLPTGTPRASPLP